MFFKAGKARQRGDLQQVTNRVFHCCTVSVHLLHSDKQTRVNVCVFITQPRRFGRCQHFSIVCLRKSQSWANKEELMVAGRCRRGNWRRRLRNPRHRRTPSGSSTGPSHSSKNWQGLKNLGIQFESSSGVQIITAKNLFLSFPNRSL